MKINKFHPSNGYKFPDGKYRYTFTLFLTSALDGGEWSTPRPGRFNPGKVPVPIVQEVERASGKVWMGAEYLAFTGIRFPNFPAPIEPLYRLIYPRPTYHMNRQHYVHVIGSGYCIQRHTYSYTQTNY
jgi:hypothetical protein